jgi:arylsulfatase A-like enzyme
MHVNVVNADMSVLNPNDPVSGFAGVPRNMTGLAAQLKKAGYATHMVGKWDAGMATPDHSPEGRGLVFIGRVRVEPIGARTHSHHLSSAPPPPRHHLPPPGTTQV